MQNDIEAARIAQAVVTLLRLLGRMQPAKALACDLLVRQVRETFDLEA